MANRFEVDVEIDSRIAAAKDKLRPAVTGALSQLAEEIMTASKEVVPVDTGALMNSGHVEAVRQEGEVLTVTLGYGGPAVDYALAVHENLDSNVHWKRPGSGPKYLENPLKERQDKLSPEIAEAVKVSLG